MKAESVNGGSTSARLGWRRHRLSHAQHLVESAQHDGVHAERGASADQLVARMREHPSGREARIIGEARADPPGIVAMNTSFGGTRIVDMLVGEQLPRIC